MKLIEIWRYPVKSMLGESLDSAEIGPGGIAGDRHWAVVDAESGVSLSAKRYADLLRCRSSTRDGVVMIELPDGGIFPAGSTDAAAALTELLGRDVRTRSAREADRIQHEFPTAVTEGKGEPFLWTPGTDAFFDSATLHLLTTATLGALRRLQPESDFHRARFRPNFLVETDDSGFVENDWVGRDMLLGSLRCRVVDPTKRCVMVSRAQGNLPHDAKVVRAVYEHNDGNAGVALQMRDTGILSCGSEIEVSD